MFKKTYKKVSKIPRKQADRLIKKSNRSYLNNKPTQRVECESPIMLEEMELVIDETKTDKAAGQDDIPNEFIKKLGPKAKQLMLHMYNRIWSGEEIPHKWRVATIKPLLKDGKDPAFPSSYRPISLTACLGKVMEKIVANRLGKFLENNKLINENQAGFRTERCTADQVLKLVQMATDTMQNKKEAGSATVITFFDFEKAYDKVWRDGLLSKMIHMKIPYLFIKYVRHFLSARKTRVEVNRTSSDNFWLNEGLPQGSAISPLLFLIFINDIDTEIHRNANPSLFADDTAVWVTVGKTRTAAEQKMQQSVNAISAWADRWKMSLNIDKTEAMIISSNNADTNWKPNVQLKGVPIKIVKEYKFLGVTIDGGLRFKTHVNRVIAKGKKRNKVMRCLAGKDWGQRMETQRTLYITYVRSALEYANASWYPWIGKRRRKRLEAVQNESLRIMTRMSKTTPLDFLRCETNIEPLEERMKKNSMITYEKYSRLEESDARRRLMEKEVTHGLKTRHGWRHETKKEMTQFKEINRDTPRISIPPWKNTTLTTTEVELPGRKETITEDELKRRTLEKIAEINADVEIYTDGSTSGEQKNGGAGIHIRNREGTVLHEENVAAGSLCSSFDGECIAMREATRWINTQPEEQKHFVIFTDSRSLVDTLRKDNWRQSHEWLKAVKEILTTCKQWVTVCWIPSHCGTDGNERADKLASEGTNKDQENAPVTLSIIKSKIRGHKWEFEHQREADTFKERRKPKYDIEKKWPENVRRSYSRMRSGHDKKLKSYRHFIGTEENSDCEECGERDNIEHALCKCPALEARRRKFRYDGNFTVEDLVNDPETCRKVLMQRFPELATKNQADEESNSLKDNVVQPSGLQGGSGSQDLE